MTHLALPAALSGVRRRRSGIRNEVRRGPAMPLILVHLFLVSGPIREKLWMAQLALLLSVGMCLASLHWLLTPGAVDRVSWAFPLRGRWLRSLLRVAAVASAVFACFLFATSGLGLFQLFPWLSR